MLSTDKQTNKQTNRQTDKLTNATKNITSFAKEVKRRKYWKVKVTHQVIRKGHRFVESAMRLLLLNKHKKFENDAITRFCSSVDNSKKWEKNNTGTGSITRLTKRYSVNN